MKFSFFSILVFIAMLFAGAAETIAQPVCPPGSTTTTQAFSAPLPDGGCCTITVTYCYLYSGTTLTLVIGTITVPADCPLIVNPGLFNWLSKKIVFRLSLAGGIPEIFNCPTTTQLTVETGQSSYYMKQYALVGGTGFNIYNPCGTSICLRRCAVCLSTSQTDPCSTPANEPMLQYVGCVYTTVPCVPDASKPDCVINTCDSN